MTILYDPKKPLRALRSWKGTILPMVVSRTEIFAFICLHVILLALRMETDVRLMTVPWSIVAIPSGLLAFFIVFFTSNCLNRYNMLYGHCCGIGGLCQEGTAQICLHMKAQQFQAKWNAIRFLLSSGYVEYSIEKPGNLKQNGTWQVLLNKNLLTEAELNYIDDYKGNKVFLLQRWSLMVVKQSFQDAGFRDAMPREFFHIEETVLALRRACAGISNAMKMPIPFAYFHVLNLMMFINYLLYGYALIFFKTWSTIGVMFLILVVTTGMREVSSALANPFGTDEVDFPVDDMMNATYNACTHILKDSYENTNPGGAPSGGNTESKPAIADSKPPSNQPMPVKSATAMAASPHGVQVQMQGWQQPMFYGSNVGPGNMLANKIIPAPAQMPMPAPSMSQQPMPPMPQPMPPMTQPKPLPSPAQQAMLAAGNYPASRAHCPPSQAIAPQL